LRLYIICLDYTIQQILNLKFVGLYNHKRTPPITYALFLNLYLQVITPGYCELPRFLRTLDATAPAQESQARSQIYGFSSGKSLAEFLCHILESAPSLECLTLETGHHVRKVCRDAPLANLGDAACCALGQ
jgi:hypothetical protein